MNLYYSYIKRPVIKIIRIFRLLPMLWRFESWDQYHLFSTLHDIMIEFRRDWLDCKKIHIIEKSRLLNIKTLTIAANIFKRLAADEYGQTPFLDYETPKMSSTPHSYDAKGKVEYYRVIFTYSSEEAEKLARIKSKKQAKVAAKLRENDIDLLAKILKTQSQKWWD